MVTDVFSDDTDTLKWIDYNIQYPLDSLQISEDIKKQMK